MMIRFGWLVALCLLLGCETATSKKTKEILVGFDDPQVLFQTEVVSPAGLQHLGRALLAGPFRINATLQDGAIFSERVDKETYVNSFLTADIKLDDIRKLRREKEVIGLLGDPQISLPPERGVPAVHVWRLCNGLEGIDFRARQIAIAWGDGPQRRDVTCIVIRDGRPVKIK